VPLNLYYVIDQSCIYVVVVVVVVVITLQMYTAIQKLGVSMICFKEINFYSHGCIQFIKSQKHFFKINAVLLNFPLIKD